MEKPASEISKVTRPVFNLRPSINGCSCLSSNLFPPILISINFVFLATTWAKKNPAFAIPLSLKLNATHESCPYLSSLLVFLSRCSRGRETGKGEGEGGEKKKNITLRAFNIADTPFICKLLPSRSKLSK